MKLGYCSTKALDQAGESLRGFLGDVPPVWQIGRMLGHMRWALSALFCGVAAESGHAIEDLPFAFAQIPNGRMEKRMCASLLAFRLLGMNSYHSVYAPAPGLRKR